MIVYTEKGAGLHARITAGGHWLVERDGVWQASNEAAVQALIDDYTLAEAADEIVAAIDAHAMALRMAVTATVAPAEMASWSIKRAEAQAYAASSNPADAPMLGYEAAARGVPLADVAARVQANATALAMLEAQIAGTAGKHRDAVRGLATFAELLAYNWQAGWPAVG